MENQVAGDWTAPSSQLSPQPPLPVVLGKYQLVRFLGRGNFAKVYQAYSLSDNTTVAIKIIQKSRVADISMEARIVREIDAMRRLHHHPNILRIFEVLATKTKIYLVVELASGGELFSKVSRQRRISEPEARFYVQQLVSALRFCHENGISHRDVKPQNLLLDREGQLKVSDFGLAALPEQINNNGLLHTACGTPAYAAPEVFYRRGYDGSKADAWSCGVILFVLLSGNLPFDDGNLVTMYKKIKRREYVFPEWISKPARYVIYQLLDPNPNSRMSIEALSQTKWFKKSLVQRPLVTSLEIELFAKNRKAELFSSRLNAFDIITMSSGLDLSGLFETKTGMLGSRVEKRFTSKVPMKDVMEKVGMVAGELGYRIERCRDREVLGLGKGNVAVMVEAVEIVPELLWVALTVVDGGSEFEELHWSEMRAGLQDVVWSWHSV